MRSSAEDAHERLAAQVAGHLRGAGFAVPPEAPDIGGAVVEVRRAGVFVHWHPDVRLRAEVVDAGEATLATVLRARGLTTLHHVHDGWSGTQVLDSAGGEHCLRCRDAARTIPGAAELARLGFRDLLDRIARLEPTTETGPGANWLLIEYHVRTRILERWEALEGHGWQHCADAFDHLLTLLGRYGDVPRWMVVARRFHLSTELSLAAGPRPGFPLTEPARLLRALLDEFPYPPAEAHRRSEDQHRATLHLSTLRRAEHLFPPGPDLDAYHAWWAFWHDQAAGRS